VRVVAEVLGLATGRKPSWLRLAREVRDKLKRGPVARMSNDTLGALPEPFLGRFPKVNTGKVTGI
jgi:hypothetical protein